MILSSNIGEIYWAHVTRLYTAVGSYYTECLFLSQNQIIAVISVNGDMTLISFDYKTGKYIYERGIPGKSGNDLKVYRMYLDS